MSHRVLVVCARNVCRSPLLAAALLGALPAEERPRWEVDSRGTSAVDGEPMCDVASRVGGVSGERHRSQAVVIPQLDRYDLVLVASRAERSVLASAAPHLRSRTFTLREALLLRGGAKEFGPAPPGDQDRPLLAYSEFLHSNRGLIRSRRARAGSWWSADVDPLDIPDVHGRSRHQHIRQLRWAVGDAAELGRSLKARMDERRADR